MSLQEILMTDDVVTSIKNNLTYLEELIPEIKNMYGFEQHHPHHHLDVWNHTLLALSLSEKDFDIRLSLLLHDIGKPFSYLDKEVRHFKGHAKKSYEMSQKILTRLGYDRRYVVYISYMVKNHDKKIPDQLIKENYILSSKLYKIQKCDALAHHPEKLEKRKAYICKVREKLLKRKTLF